MSRLGIGLSARTRFTAFWLLPIAGVLVLLLASAGPDAKPSALYPRTTAFGSQLYIAATAHVSGALNTDWRSDVELFNIGGTQADYEIALLEKNEPNLTPQTVGFSLSPGTSVRYNDILQTMFGFDGSAALRITSTDGALVATSRTYNQTDAGTYGQFIGGIPDHEAIDHGRQGRIVQLSHHHATASGFRTNVGFVNCSSAGIAVRVHLHRGDGALLGTKSYDLGPYMFKQIDRIFDSVTSSDVDDGYVVVETTTPGGRFLAYASVVDNRTGDPIYIPAVMVDAPAEMERQSAGWTGFLKTAGQSYIAATAHVAGAAGTNWRTDLELHNYGLSTGQYEVALLETDLANTTPMSDVLTVNAGASVRIDDILESSFEFDGTGSLRLTPQGGAVALVTSRTYNLTEDGTYGQLVGGVALAEAIEYVQRGLMIQLTHHRSTDAGYRANVGYVNCSNMSIDIRIDLYRADGALLGTVDDTLGPYMHRQKNRIFQQVTAGDVEDGYAIIRIITPGGRILAYASVVDNITGDPVYIPATSIDGGPPPPTPTPTVGPGSAMDPLVTMQALFWWLRTVPGQGPTPDLEQAVAQFQQGGIDTLLDDLVSVYPGAATRTATGFVMDCGTGYPAGDKTWMSGSFDADFSDEVNTPQRVALSATATHQNLQVDDFLPPVDSVDASVDLDVDGSGHVDGSATLSGDGSGGQNSLAGEVVVDTEVCPNYPIDGFLTVRMDDDTHQFSFGPECDGRFGYVGPGLVDLSQFNSVDLRVANLQMDFRFTDPDQCGPFAGGQTSTFHWAASDSSFTDNTFSADYEYVVSDAEIHDELTLTANPVVGLVESFWARRTVVQPDGPDNTVTKTVTITGTDFPLLCSDWGCDGIYPGPSTCDKITVEYERTNSGSPCVAVLDTLECRYTSGVVVSIR